MDFAKIGGKRKRCRGCRVSIGFAEFLPQKMKRGVNIYLKLQDLSLNFFTHKRLLESYCYFKDNKVNHQISKITSFRRHFLVMNIVSFWYLVKKTSCPSPLFQPNNLNITENPIMVELQKRKNRIKEAEKVRGFANRLETQKACRLR